MRRALTFTTTAEVLDLQYAIGFTLGEFERHPEMSELCENLRKQDIALSEILDTFEAHA
jgi:hypothetical protein